MFKVLQNNVYLIAFSSTEYI